MVKLLKYFLKSVIFFCLAGMIMSCHGDEVIYKRAYSPDERQELSESLLNAAGTDIYYQGSVAERMLIHEGNQYNPNNAWGEREIGVPYLKRGFAAEAYQYYAKAIEYDPGEWMGYKAYCWLYFYRDYAMALKEVDQCDALTPGIVDYPQSTSVNYMRGICQYFLGDYKEAQQSLSAHLEKEATDVGHEYIDALPYLSLAMTYHKMDNFEKADSLFDLGILHNENSSDLYYYKAMNLMEMDQLLDARIALENAELLYNNGAKNQRPYVEEFFAIYQEDLDLLSANLK